MHLKCYIEKRENEVVCRDCSTFSTIDRIAWYYCREESQMFISNRYSPCRPDIEWVERRWVLYIISKLLGEIVLFQGRSPGQPPCINQEAQHLFRHKIVM